MERNRRAFLQKAAMLTGAFSLNSLFNQTVAATWKSALQDKSHLLP